VQAEAQPQLLNHRWSKMLAGGRLPAPEVNNPEILKKHLNDLFKGMLRSPQVYI
jgi:hypothetical protein